MVWSFSAANSQNPYTGTAWATVADGGPDDIDRAVQSARSAFEGEWGTISGFQRAAILRHVASAITANAERLALLEVRDSGKLMREMLGQLQGLGTWYSYFSGLADKLEGRTVPAISPQTYFGHTVREPIGVVGAITAWNSPLLLLTFKLAPLLAAGCTCVCKPSEHSPASTVAFAQVLQEAGLPAGSSTWSPACSGTPAPRWLPIRASARSPSPARRPPVPRWRRRRWETSTRSRSNSAASLLRWCSPTPISTPLRTAWWQGCSPPPGRPAWPGRG